MGTRRNLGRPLQLSDDDLDKLAEITEADALRTEAKWEELVSKKFVNLLLADELPDD